MNDTTIRNAFNSGVRNELAGVLGRTQTGNNWSPVGWPRGYMVCPEQSLMLRFFVNPKEIVKTKSATYDELTVPGMDTPIITYTGGSAKTMQIKLFFDTATASSYFLPQPNRPYGVLQIEAIIESMMINYKASTPGDMQSYMGRMNAAQMFGTDVTAMFTNMTPGLAATGLRMFQPPPEVFFVYGTQFYKVKIKSAPFTERRFRKGTMIPDQLEVDMDMYIVEEGAFGEDVNAERQKMVNMETLSQDPTQVSSLSLSLYNLPDVGALLSSGSVNSIGRSATNYMASFGI